MNLGTRADIEFAKSQVDLVRLRRYRLARLREQLRALDCDAAVLLDPVNLRYAVGSRNMHVFTLRNAARYVFVPVAGPIVLFEFDNCAHLSDGIEVIDEIRPAKTVTFTASGNRVEETARAWAAEVVDLLRSARGGGGGRLAVDRLSPAAMVALQQHDVTVVDGMRPVELARAVKSGEEIDCIRIALAATELGMAEMRQALRPGMTENELWALLHRNNIELGGEHVETRLLSSGERTNPWYQECSDRVINDGDLVAFDSDTNGPLGYYADLSRTFLCGDGKASAEQRRLYRIAYEQIQTNTELLRPGMTFHEYSMKSAPITAEFLANRYLVLAHGCGLSGEYPYIAHPQDFTDKGYDGVIQENMVLCVESYVGAEGGREGVKLEEQVLITENGCEVLSRFPFEDALLRQGA